MATMAKLRAEMLAAADGDLHAHLHEQYCLLCDSVMLERAPATMFPYSPATQAPAADAPETNAAAGPITREPMIEVTQFFAAVAELEARGKMVEHSRNPSVMAYSLKQIAELALAEGIALPPLTDLRRALKTSKAPRFIIAKSVNSRYSGPLHCWIFERR